jgi:nicotinamidase-related amidase
VTKLDAKTALIVIDLQKGIVSLPTVHPVDTVVAHAGALAGAFRGHGLPVVLVNVAGGAPGRTERPRLGEPFPAGWTDLIPELDRQPGDIVVTKRTWGGVREHEPRHPTEGAGRHTGRDCRCRHRDRCRVDGAPGV